MMARNEFTIEHIQPLSMGGTYEMKNLAAACKPCNEEFGRLTERIVQKKRDMADCALTRKIAREKATLETLNRRFALP